MNTCVCECTHSLRLEYAIFDIEKTEQFLLLSMKISVVGQCECCVGLHVLYLLFTEHETTTPYARSSTRSGCGEPSIHDVFLADTLMARNKYVLIDSLRSATCTTYCDSFISTPHSTPCGHHRRRAHCVQCKRT